MESVFGKCHSRMSGFSQALPALEVECSYGETLGHRVFGTTKVNFVQLNVESSKALRSKLPKKP